MPFSISDEEAVMIKESQPMAPAAPLDYCLRENTQEIVESSQHSEFMLGFLADIKAVQQNTAQRAAHSEWSKS